MKRIMMLLCGLCLPVWLAVAQVSGEVKALENVFRNLKADRNCTTAQVKYTGSDFKKAGGAFLWQNNGGLGWTVGERLTLKDVSKRQLCSLQKTFKEVAQLQYVSQYVDDKLEQQCTAFSQSRRVYAYRYDKLARCLYVLAAACPPCGIAVTRWMPLQRKCGATPLRGSTRRRCACSDCRGCGRA